jgi:hypothetical protein
MVVCPVALAVGCRKCPVFSVCPVKSVIGDYVPPEKPPSPQAATARAASAAGPAAKTAKAKPKGGDKPTAGEGKRRSPRRRTP